MLIWAGPVNDAPELADVILWNAAVKRGGFRSISGYIEMHADEIRRRCLAWFHEFGELPILGRPLRERFASTDGARLWPLSMFVELSPWRMACFEELLKMFAVEKLIDEEAPETVTFAGADRDVHLAFEALCKRRGIRYSWTKLSANARFTGMRASAGSLPHVVQGVLVQLHLCATRLTLRRPPKLPHEAKNKRALICGPLFNQDFEPDRSDRFASKYWTVLPAMLLTAGYDVHWLHVFYAHDKIRSVRAASNMLEHITAASEPLGTHSLLDSYLTIGGAVRIFRSWLSNALTSFVVGFLARRRMRKYSSASYWALIRGDWARAFRGAGCVQSLYFAECFNAAMRELPHQEEGLYLMENQGWERALARAWRLNDHGRLAAVAHTTVRFWDLRYHCDPRRYQTANAGVIPVPSVVAVNGIAAREAYLATCANREPLTDCEALRYLHLKRGVPRAFEDADGGNALRVLVLGDFLRPATESLLLLLGEARNAVKMPIDIWVKAHPNCPVDPSQFPGLQFRVVDDAVANLVPSAHLVLASNTTSASVDAYVSGGRMIVLHDGVGVNISPLRGISGVAFVADAADLAVAIETIHRAEKQRDQPAREFFTIDPELTRWRRYFGIGRGALEESSR